MAWTPQKLPAAALGCRSARPLAPPLTATGYLQTLYSSSDPAALTLQAQRVRGANTFEKHQSATASQSLMLDWPSKKPSRSRSTVGSYITRQLGQSHCRPALGPQQQGLPHCLQTDCSPATRMPRQRVSPTVARLLYHGSRFSHTAAQLTMAFGRQGPAVAGSAPLPPSPDTAAARSAPLSLRQAAAAGQPHCRSAHGGPQTAGMPRQQGQSHCRPAPVVYPLFARGNTSRSMSFPAGSSAATHRSVCALPPFGQ